MPTITRITEQKRQPNRRNIFLDGRFAFGCNINVVARFRLTVGKQLTADEVKEIEFGEVKQECFDKAMEHLSRRMHSRAEMFQKLKRNEWGDPVIDSVIEQLTAMNYLDDARFARTKASAAASHKQHGRRRAFLELIKSGVKGDVADQALKDVYSQVDSTAIARDLARKHAPRLQKLDPQTARRRLAGMLQRRGFDYESIRPVIDEILGKARENKESQDIQ
jgi:regulatory protein